MTDSRNKITKSKMKFLARQDAIDLDMVIQVCDVAIGKAAAVLAFQFDNIFANNNELEKLKSPREMKQLSQVAKDLAEIRAVIFQNKGEGKPPDEAKISNSIEKADRAKEKFDGD